LLEERQTKRIPAISEVVKLRGIVRAKRIGRKRRLQNSITNLLSTYRNRQRLVGVFTRPISKLRSSAEFDHQDSRGIPLAPSLADKTHEQMRLPTGLGSKRPFWRFRVSRVTFLTR
jgi:hypothetical protein